MVERHPRFADDPKYQPGGMYWHLDHADYHEVRADVLETLAVMLWEELVYLRDGSVPQGSGLPREARLSNIRTMANQYLFWAQKDLRPQGLWDQPF